MSVGRFASIAAVAIRRPVTTAMLFLGLGLLGALSYRELPLQLMPNVALPSLFVEVAFPGASPDAVEDEAIRILEGELATVAGIEEIRSSARTGGGTIEAKFERGIDLEFAALSVEERLARARERLPETVFLSVQRVDTSAFSNFVMVLSFRGDTDIETMRRLADDVVVPVLTGVDGVVRVSVQGGAAKQVGVFLDPERARARGVSVTDVRRAMRDATRPVQAVGEVTQRAQRMPVVVDGRARRLSDVADAPVGGQRSVRLSHVADIQPGIAGFTDFYRVNGRTSVGLYVFKDQQTNLIEVARRLRESIDAFNAEHAEEQLEVGVDFDAAEYMETELEKLARRATAGGLLALVVLLVFLGARPLTIFMLALPTLAVTLDVMGLFSGAVHEAVETASPWLAASVLGLLLVRRDARPVAIVALAMPASLLIAFALFRAADLNLNVLTVLGLALAIGMLLDNAIVVLEAIAARREVGDGPIEAARNGATRVQRAVLTGTFTTLVVFVPIFMVQLDQGALFEELAYAVSFPLVASLIVAVSLVPMMASRLAERAVDDPPPRLPGPNGAPRPSRARAAYSVVLRSALRHPLAAMAVFFLLLVVTLVFGVPMVAVMAEPPRPPEGRIELRAELEPGSTTEAVDAVAQRLEAEAMKLPEVDEVQAAVRDEVATVTVVFKDAEDRERPVSVDRARDRMKRSVRSMGEADVEVDPAPQRGQGGGFGAAEGSQEIVRVVGPDADTLIDVASRVRERLEQIPGVGSVSWDAAETRPTIEVVPDRQRLAEYGLTTAELIGVIWAARREGEPARYPFRLGDEDVDLVLWIEGGDERTVADVREFPLTTRTGARVPLSAVSTVTTNVERPEVKRWQRERSVTLRYDFDRREARGGEAVEIVRDSVDRAVATMALPAGYSVDVEHADEPWKPAKRMLRLGLLLVFMVLAMAFESVVLPALVMLCVPLAIVGVIWSLVLTGTGIGPLVPLAVIVLLGIVVNNGILFVDRSQALLAAGARRPAAVLRAAHERLRPVLMTTTTTVVGMLPLAVDTGGQEQWPGFGRAVVGGLLASTVISLVVVPVGTLVLGNLADLLRRLGMAVTVAAAVASAGAFSWLMHVDMLGELAVWVLAGPVFLGLLAIARAVQRWVRGEAPPTLVSEEGPLRLTVRSARKIYGGLPRPAREYARLDRWRRLALERGMSEREIDTPAQARRGLTWLVGALTLLVVLHVLAESTWGLLLLTLPLFGLLDGCVRALLVLAGRPARWPPGGWLGRTWPVASLLGAWGYLFWRQRPGEAVDDVVVVLAAVIFGLSAVLHLLGRGGFRGQLARWLAPEPLEALHGVDLDFGVGLYGLLGPNGAGKSTLMRLAVNLLRPTRGQVQVNGHEVRSHAASLQATIGYLPQFFGVPPRLTAREYLHHQALLAGHGDRRRRRELVESVLGEVGLANRGDEPLGGFSGGMRQRVGIARTLLNVPRVVVVDEPTVGLDPRERIRFRQLLARLAETRIVLLSTHVVEDIGSACREVVVLDRGEVLFRGRPAELVERARGEVWVAELAAADLAGVSDRHRIVTSTRVPGGRVRVRGVGPRPAGAEDAQPTLEDAYLLLLGRPADDEGGAHAA